MKIKRWIIAIALAVGGASALCAQEKIPSPPADTTLIYVGGPEGELMSLPVEVGTATVSVVAVAKNDKKGFVELAGTAAATSVNQASPRLYIFIPSGPGVHPAFVVRLDIDKGKRRVPIMLQKGLTGFAVPTDHIVIPHYRVLSTLGRLSFMEITPRLPLVPGEYAVMGEDLNRIATFRVVATSLN
ncbi:MAG: hypothetical protein ABIP75_07600 [Pyrinomonadaceae bacterium]